MENKSLRQEVEEIKRVGEMLVHLTFPRVDFKAEQDVLLLKQRTLLVDAYEVIICYSKADYDDHIMESIQIQPSFTPFLPFAVVCKLGRAFLGTKNLSYIEFFKHNRKVYCWTVKLRDERVLPPDKTSKVETYEGFEFNILQPGSVDLF
jgi:hypothetical protein